MKKSLFSLLAIMNVGCMIYAMEIEKQLPSAEKLKIYLAEDHRLKGLHEIVSNEFGDKMASYNMVTEFIWDKIHAQCEYFPISTGKYVETMVKLMFKDYPELREAIKAENIRDHLAELEAVEPKDDFEREMLKFGFKPF